MPISENPGGGSAVAGADAAARARVSALEGPDLYIIATASASPAAAEFNNVATVHNGKILASAEDDRICVAWSENVAGTPLVLTDGVVDSTFAEVAGTIQIGGAAHKRGVTDSLGAQAALLVQVIFP